MASAMWGVLRLLLGFIWFHCTPGPYLVDWQDVVVP